MEHGPDHMSAREAFARAMETLRHQGPERASSSAEATTASDAVDAAPMAAAQDATVARVDAADAGQRIEARRELARRLADVIADDRPLEDPEKSREMDALKEAIAKTEPVRPAA